jgi:serine kinase of HPr protein (carbohydrate metabolism regulator)
MHTKCCQVICKILLGKVNVKREIDININVKELKYEDSKWIGWLRIVTTSRIVLNTVKEFAFYMKLRLVHRLTPYVLHYCVDNLIAKWSYT